MQSRAHQIQEFRTGIQHLSTPRVRRFQKLPGTGIVVMVQFRFQKVGSGSGSGSVSVLKRSVPVPFSFGTAILYLFPIHSPKSVYSTEQLNFCFFSLFNRDRSIFECIFCIILAIIVSIVGLHVLHNDVYYDLEILVYCCVIAASQYSLLKSCQPDVNTPVHVTKFFFKYFNFYI
jgi:hypothetical protein